MSSDTGPEGQRLVVALEAEIRAVRRQLAQREQALVLLNTRLLRLERGEVDLASLEVARGGNIASENARLRAEVATLEDDLRWLRQSRIFRWSRPARQAFYAARRVVRRP